MGRGMVGAGARLTARPTAETGGLALSTMRTARWAAFVVLLATAACSGGGADVTARVASPSTTAVAAPPAVPAPPPKATIATAVGPTVDSFSEPSVAGAPLASMTNPNELGAPLVFLVKARQGDWLNVMLPMRPNGVTGWIQAGSVTLSESDWRSKIELGAHRLTVWHGNEVVVEAPVAVGTSSAPTPVGDFYLTELLDTGNPTGAYGPYAFGLSSFSDVYTEFAGGPGQIGLHGTNAPELLGTDVSHGCIRVDNDTINRLASELPIGTPIAVVA